MGYPNASNVWQFQNQLSFKVMEIIQQHSSGKPVVIFCNTRKDCVSTAEALAKAYRQFISPSGRSSQLPWPRPARSYATAIDKKLNELFEVGVSYHHAGLDGADRKLIETGFIGGSISIVCKLIGANCRLGMFFAYNEAQYRCYFYPRSRCQFTSSNGCHQRNFAISRWRF